MMCIRGCEISRVCVCGDEAMGWVEKGERREEKGEGRNAKKNE